MKLGKIYFLQRPDGLIKIGYTTNLKRRIESLSRSHGTLNVLRTINGDKQREKRIQTSLRRHNEFGEWFRAHAAVLTTADQIEEGTAVEVAKSDGDRAWMDGERRAVQEAQDYLARLVTTRQQRTGLKHVPAMKAVAADYKLRYWTLLHLHAGKPSVVTAHAYNSLRAALVAEMEAFRDDLVAELAACGDEPAARIQAKKAARRPMK